MMRSTHLLEQSIHGDYTGRYRPQVHFSPPKGFMNDPNGLFVDKHGIWHLYYQYNPTELVAGNQHWGHATSRDLYHWANQPIALFPPDERTGVFSGSAVIDAKNTSGFFPDQDDGVVAIYTLNTPENQVQAIAYSRDGGYTFTPYEGNPVIDIQSNQFRDPKVVWYEDHWVMVIAHSTEFKIGIYTSRDLKTWSPSSSVSYLGILGLQYECPNLVPIPVKANGSSTGEQVWTLFISINPGAPLGGATMLYFPGDFDGYSFVPHDSAARLADFAKDNYAAQFFDGTAPGEAVSIAWANNWQYTNVLPTANEGWRSIMSLPRKNFLTRLERTGWALVSEPYDLSPILNSRLSHDTDFVNKTTDVDFSSAGSGAIYFSIKLPDSQARYGDEAAFSFAVSAPSSKESVKGGYMFGGPNAGHAWLDRGNTKGFGSDNPFWNDRFSVAQVSAARSIWGVIDRSVLELFIDDGAYSATMLFFSEEPLTLLRIGTEGMPEGTSIELEVHDLHSVWRNS
ncbi:glycosyl hydrolase [Kockovaella imperatae]|uniref:Glycosyl hydrolase n=1 Tax=Kockovaella imperatae TaxID=4999 RepID=A0A1Y1U9Z2_9TREE|nr:glycosyl hydrolase [Kockovaella imperatae]ORX34843.1 glycosyl hydrolase [Kockovaella imperatae]